MIKLFRIYHAERKKGAFEMRFSPIRLATITFGENNSQRSCLRMNNLHFVLHPLTSCLLPDNLFPDGLGNRFRAAPDRQLLVNLFQVPAHRFR